MPVSNEEKQGVWDAYRVHKPTRVPVTYGVNPRVILLDPAFNAQGTSFEEYYRSGAAAADIQLRFMDYQAEYLNRFSDSPMGRPKEFTFYVDTQNIYDAAYFGCPVRFHDGQVADVSPILAGRDKNRIFAFDRDRPLENPFVRECFARHESLAAAVAKLSVPGVTFQVRPITMGWDGPRHDCRPTARRGVHDGPRRQPRVCREAHAVPSRGRHHSQPGPRRPGRGADLPGAGRRRRRRFHPAHRPRDVPRSGPAPAPRVVRPLRPRPARHPPLRRRHAPFPDDPHGTQRLLVRHRVPGRSRGAAAGARPRRGNPRRPGSADFFSAAHATRSTHGRRGSCNRA